MKHYYFVLQLTAAQFHQYYRGEVRTVTVRAHTGQWLNFPAEHLRRYLTHSGVSGEFELITDNNHKFIALNKIVKP